MDILELARALLDIESPTEHEGALTNFLFDHLSELTRRFDGQLERMPVAAGRDNLFACWGEPRVTYSTHMDTVPPHFPLREDNEFLYGRGACDAKGIMAAMIEAARELLESGTRNIALLFVVGEERNSAGAIAAAQNPRGSRFLINGEPTENRLVLGTKGALRFEIEAQGRLAHSAYPELGDSAIEKLLDTLAAIRALPLRSDALLGRETLNIGTISGGRAPNVIADKASAEILFRIVTDPEALRAAICKSLPPGVEAREILCHLPVRLSSFDGLPSAVAAFTTDIPAFDGKWGQPFLIGPGSIHVAHTLDERISKREMQEATKIYARMARQLLARGEAA